MVRACSDRYCGMFTPRAVTAPGLAQHRATAPHQANAVTGSGWVRQSDQSLGWPALGGTCAVVLSQVKVAIIHLTQKGHSAVSEPGQS